MAAYDARLATRTTADVSRRLRLLALLRGLPLSHLLTELLDKSLPTAETLAGQLRNGHGDDN
jgi:hypothetical protein